MKDSRLFVVNEPGEVDAELRRAYPHARRAERDRERRQDREPILEQERKLDGIGRVGPEPDPERIEDGVAPGIGLARLRELMAKQKVRTDRHRQTGSQVKTSPERSRG